MLEGQKILRVEREQEATNAALMTTAEALTKPFISSAGKSSEQPRILPTILGLEPLPQLVKPSKKGEGGEFEVAILDHSPVQVMFLPSPNSGVSNLRRKS